MKIHPCMGREGGGDDDRVGRPDQRRDVNDQFDLKDPVQVSVPCSDDKVSWCPPTSNRHPAIQTSISKSAM